MRPTRRAPGGATRSDAIAGSGLFQFHGGAAAARRRCTAVSASAAYHLRHIPPYTTTARAAQKLRH